MKLKPASLLKRDYAQAFVCFSPHAFTLKKHTTQASSVWITNNHCLLRLSLIPQLTEYLLCAKIMHWGHQNDKVWVPGFFSKWGSKQAKS